jgi:hypothetical protein
VEQSNPFRYGAPVEGESFCDRDDELATLVARMRSGIHAFVLSPRRYGKTSLLLEALRRFRARGGRGGYANLLLCTTEDELASVVLTAVVREVLRPAGRARHSLEDVIRRLRVVPHITATPSGSVTLTIDPAIGATRWLDVIRDAMDLLNTGAKAKPAALVLDEFQQIAEIGRSGLGGAFKALADETRHASLVFSGSHLSVMERLTRSRGAPLLGMGETIRLEVIPEAAMVAYLVDRAASGGKRMSADVAREMYVQAGGVPNDVQWLAHSTFEMARAARTVTADHVAAGLTTVVDRQATTFAERFEALSPSQQRIVRHLANGPVAKVYAKAFLDAVRVANANAVTTALKALAHLELVQHDANGWHLTSPFFRAWLLRQMAGDTT